MSFDRKTSRSSTTPLFKGTSNSSVDGGIVSLDPTIRSLQERGITGVGDASRALGEATGRFGSSLGDLRSKLFSGLDPYLEARVSPLKEQQALSEGAAVRNLDRRGLSGSSFRDQTLAGIATDFGRQIADQRALGTQESLRTALDIDQMLLEAKQLEASGRMKEAEYLRGIASDRANAELAIITSTGSNQSSSGFGVGLVPSSGSGGGVA